MPLPLAAAAVVFVLSVVSVPALSKRQVYGNLSGESFQSDATDSAAVSPPRPRFGGGTEGVLAAAAVTPVGGSGGFGGIVKAVVELCLLIADLVIVVAAAATAIMGFVRRGGGHQTNGIAVGGGHVQASRDAHGLQGSHPLVYLVVIHGEGRE